MNWIETTLWVSGLVLGLFALHETISSTESPPTHTNLWFSRLDTDKDGRISSTEFAVRGSSINIFHLLDCNNNESIEQEELEEQLSSIDPFWFYEDVE